MMSSGERPRKYSLIVFSSPLLCLLLVFSLHPQFSITSEKDSLRKICEKTTSESLEKYKHSAKFEGDYYMRSLSRPALRDVCRVLEDLSDSGHSFASIVKSSTSIPFSWSKWWLNHYVGQWKSGKQKNRKEARDTLLADILVASRSFPVDLHRVRAPSPTWQHTNYFVGTGVTSLIHGLVWQAVPYTTREFSICSDVLNDTESDILTWNCIHGIGHGLFHAQIMKDTGIEKRACTDYSVVQNASALESQLERSVEECRSMSFASSVFDPCVDGATHSFFNYGGVDIGSSLSVYEPCVSLKVPTVECFVQSMEFGHATYKWKRKGGWETPLPSITYCLSDSYSKTTSLACLTAFAWFVYPALFDYHYPLVITPMCTFYYHMEAPRCVIDEEERKKHVGFLMDHSETGRTLGLVSRLCRIVSTEKDSEYETACVRGAADALKYYSPPVSSDAVVRGCEAVSEKVEMRSECMQIGNGSLHGIRRQ